MVDVGASVVVGGAVVLVLDGDVVAAPAPIAGPATVAASAESATTATIAAARARAPPIRRGSMPLGAPDRYAGYPTWRLWPSQYGSRSLNFWSLPVAVRVSASRSSTDVGHLKCASRPRQCSRSARSSMVAPGASTTSAFTVSPHFSSGTPMTAASATSGCEHSASSTSIDDTFSPPLMITSFFRSEIDT